MTLPIGLFVYSMVFPGGTARALPIKAITISTVSRIATFFIYSPPFLINFPHKQVTYEDASRLP
jgi:drug/metabolite transporter (DMT)-like permease